jgi:hypothetical protein
MYLIQYLNLKEIVLLVEPSADGKIVPALK